MRPSRTAALALCALTAACGSTVTHTAGTAAGSLGSDVGAGTGTTAGTPGSVPLTSSVGSSTGSSTLPGASTSTGAASSGSTNLASYSSSDPSGIVSGSAKQPVKLGIVLTDTSAAATALGYNPGNTLTERQIDDGLIKALNAHGGLAGRQIQPVFASTSVTSSSWEGDFSAACAKFTQDNHVAAVVGYVFNYYSSFETCLAKHGVVHLTTSFNIADPKELSAYPLLYSLIVPTIERRSLAKIDGAVATGLLTPKNRLGLLTDDCPGTLRSLNETVLPALKRRGLTVTRTVQVHCVNGNADASEANADIQSAELAFASARVDRIMPHTVSEGPLLAGFALQAQSQGYHPDYIVSSLANLAFNNGYTPEAQDQNVYGFGWMPIEDVLPAYYGKRNSAQLRCLSLLASQGLKPTAAADYQWAYMMCDSFFTYEAALAHDGGSSVGTAVMQAVHSLGTSLVSSVLLGGHSIFAAGRLDTVSAARPLKWNHACQCWLYYDQLRPIPSS